MEWILQPWPWYIAGPLIGLMVPALLLLSGKTFGVSTSFQNLGSMCAPKSNLPYLKTSIGAVIDGSWCLWPALS